jgi:hypothetical protein
MKLRHRKDLPHGLVCHNGEGDGSMEDVTKIRAMSNLAHDLGLDFDDPDVPDLGEAGFRLMLHMEKQGMSTAETVHGMILALCRYSLERRIPASKVVRAWGSFVDFATEERDEEI